MDTTINRQLLVLEQGSNALTCGVLARIEATQRWHQIHDWTPAFPANFGAFYPRVKQCMAVALRAYQTGGGASMAVPEPQWFQLISRECLCPRLTPVLRAQIAIPHDLPQLNEGLPCAFYLRRASATAQWLLACETEVLRIYLEQFVSLQRVGEVSAAAELQLRRIEVIGEYATQVAHLLDVRHPKLGAPNNPELYEPMADCVIQLKSILGMFDPEDSPLGADFHRPLHAFLTLWPYVYDWTSAVSNIGAQIESLLGNSPEPPAGTKE